MKTVCTLLVPGVDIPGTMYRAISATTSLALRVIFMKILKNLLVYMHIHSMMLPCWLISFLNCWSLEFIRSKLGRKHQFCFLNEWVRSSGDYFQVVRLRSNKKQTEVINIRRYKRIAGKKLNCNLTLRMFRHTSSEVIYDYFHLVAANQFLRYLDICLAHIKFTVEFEENNTISFLDILIKHSNHSFSTSIFIAKWDSFTPRK